MRAKPVLQIASLLALVLTLVTASYAFGCIPDEDHPGRCVKRPTPIRPVVLALPTAKPTPLGINPETARSPSDQWSYIAPGSTIWYRIDDSGTLEIFMNANGQSGITFSVYAPDQKDLYGPPIGRGTKSAVLPYDLFWTGRTAVRGTWYAVVRNDNPFPVNYALNYQRKIGSVADRCASCHGYEIEWDRCESDTGWCEGLSEEYGH